MALQPWQKGIVLDVQQETHNTRRYWIQLPEVAVFDFLPGQFVTLDLPIHERPAKRWRSYSIASWPNNTNVLELIIVCLDGGLGTRYLFNEVHVGSELVLRGPQGVFTLPQTIDCDLYFICTGTGIAPFRSMVQYLKLHQIPHKNLYLVFGTRTKKDLLYFDELCHLQQQLEGFQYLPSLSREQWEGCCGYVHNVYENLVQQKAKQSGQLPPARFYLCGWKQMIDEAKQKIVQLGYERKAIHLELYG